MSWDKGKPIAGRKARYIDDDIRTNNEALEDAISFGHDFATGSTQTGEHNDGSAKIYSAAAAPTLKEDGVTALDADDVGKRLWYDTGNSLLKVLTAIGSPNTWTSVAQLIGMLDEDDMSSDSAVLPASQQSIKAYSDSGTQTMTNKTLTSPVLNGDLSGGAILDEDNMASDSATKVPTQQSVKKYVDDQIDATVGSGTASPLAVISTTKSVTWPNGLIEKWGTASSEGTVTFPEAFPNECFDVQLTMVIDSSGSSDKNVTLRSKSKTAFVYGSWGSSAENITWRAIGY